ncbi:Uncharacterised protein [Klebsiella oxytoca]|nr:Uncharacterised protein [Klebsiella oxytoca]
MNLAGRPYLLQQHAEDVLMVEGFLGIIDNHIETESFCAGTYHVQSLRMNIGGNKENG